MDKEEIKNAMKNKVQDIQTAFNEKNQDLKQKLSEQLQETQAFLQQLNAAQSSLEPTLQHSQTLLSELEQAVNLEQEFANYEQALAKEELLEVEILDLNRNFEREIQEKINQHSNELRAKLQSAFDEMESTALQVKTSLAIKTEAKESKLQQFKQKAAPYWQKGKALLANQLEWCVTKLRAA